MEQTTAPVRSEPADAPPTAAIPQGAMAEPVPDELAQARSQRQELREQGRAADSGWWDDETLAERLGLEPEQRSALLEARATLLGARLEGRTRLSEQRSTLRGTQDAGDPERLAELRESRQAVNREIEAAEQVWEDAVQSILNREQLERLRAEQPETLERPSSG